MWSGRRKKPGSEGQRDWNKYKKDSKKRKLKEASKDSVNIKKMFADYNNKMTCKDSGETVEITAAQEVEKNVFQRKEYDKNNNDDSTLDSTFQADSINSFLQHSNIGHTFQDDSQSSSDLPVGEDAEWREDESVPITWKVKEFLTKAGQKLEHIQSPTGIFFPSRKGAVEWMREQGNWSNEDIELMQSKLKIRWTEDESFGLDNNGIKYDNEQEEEEAVSSMPPVTIPSPLPFFINGCHDVAAAGKGKTNFTCAPDTIYSLVEAVLLAEGGLAWHDCKDPIIVQATKLLKWRLQNNFSWNHRAREPFWEALCQHFPAEFLPKGTINAALDKAVDHIASKSQIEVIFNAKCLRCEQDLGWFKYRYEQPLLVSTVNLESVPGTLAELCLVLISRQAQHLLGSGGKRVQCFKCLNWGAKTQTISNLNLMLPTVIDI